MNLDNWAYKKNECIGTPLEWPEKPCRAVSQTSVPDPAYLGNVLEMHFRPLDPQTWRWGAVICGLTCPSQVTLLCPHVWKQQPRKSVGSLCSILPHSLCLKTVVMNFGSLERGSPLQRDWMEILSSPRSSVPIVEGSLLYLLHYTLHSPSILMNSYCLFWTREKPTHKHTQLLSRLSI